MITVTGTDYDTDSTEVERIFFLEAQDDDQALILAGSLMPVTAMETVTNVKTERM